MDEIDLKDMYVNISLLSKSFNRETRKMKITTKESVMTNKQGGGAHSWQFKRYIKHTGSSQWKLPVEIAYPYVKHEKQ